MLQMTILKVVNVTTVTYGSVPAIRAVHMRCRHDLPRCLASLRWTLELSPIGGNQANSVVLKILSAKSSPRAARALAPELSNLGHRKVPTLAGRSVKLPSSGPTQPATVEAARDARGASRRHPEGLAGSAARRHPAGLRRGGTALSASRPAGCNFGPRTVVDLGRCPSAGPRKGAEAEGQGSEAQAAPWQASASDDERGTPASSSTPVVRAAGVFSFRGPSGYTHKRMR
jgi:hypothetical protein